MSLLRRRFHISDARTDVHRRNPSIYLYRGIKQLGVCDSGAVVAGIADFVMSQHRGLRLVERAMRPGSTFAVVVILLNAFRCFVGVDWAGHGPAVIAVRRPNERREIARLKGMLSDRTWTELMVRWRLRSVVAATRTLARTLVADCRRSARLARRLSRRYGVFHAFRALELVAYYRRYVELFATRSFQVAVMSSHSNPHGIALHVVARQFGVPVVLITHGMPIRPIARLDYDLAIVEGEASRQMYEAAGCRMDSVVIKSRRGDYAPMRVPIPAHDLTVGLFLSKDPDEAQILHCLHLLLADARIARVVIRPHPVNLWTGLDACVTSLAEPRLTIRTSGSLLDDLRLCDLVVAGNSTVLLDAVIAGRPGCYVRGFDHGPHDVQSFVADGLIYEWTPQQSLDVAAVEAFYRQPEWPIVLRRHADVDRSDADVTIAVVAAINRLMPLREAAA
jgi:hypothetical protein